RGQRLPLTRACSGRDTAGPGHRQGLDHGRAHPRHLHGDARRALGYRNLQLRLRPVQRLQVIFLKRQLPLAVTFVMGVTFAFQYYIPHPVSEEAITTVSKWMQIISGFALALGLASIFHVHAVKIKRQVPGWGYSIVLYAAMLITLIVGFWSKGETKTDGAQTALGWLYDYSMVPLQGTTFSILAFFIASADYRAFP